MGALCKQAVTFQIQVDTLEEMLQVEDAIAASLQHFEFVVEPFDEPTVCPTDEVVGDLLPPICQGFQEIVKALQAASLDPFDPGLDFDLGNLFGNLLLKDSRQLLATSLAGKLLFERRR